MKFLLQFTPGLLAIGLAATLTACGDDAVPVDSPAVQKQAVANDCRSPAAQSTQHGCKPATRMIAHQ